MKNPIRPLPVGEAKATGNTSTEIADRRAVPRQQFVAEAQVVEITSGLRLSARSCDLVLHGCYVDTLRPFPVGTLVRIRLKKEGTAIEVNGNVVYEQAGLGMGIAFHDLTPESHAIVDRWLSPKGAQEQSVEALLPPLDAEPPAANSPQQSKPDLLELVQLLINKGLLTRTEAARFLKDPLGE